MSYQKKVKSELAIAADTYNKVKMQLTITHQGNKGLKTIDYIYCTICQKDKVPALLEKCKEKLLENPKINNLIDNWNILNISSDLLDLSGCFIQDERHVNAAPNGRRSILRPTEHAASHRRLSRVPSYQVSNKASI